MIFFRIIQYTAAVTINEINAAAALVTFYKKTRDLCNMHIKMKRADKLKTLNYLFLYIYSFFLSFYHIRNNYDITKLPLSKL